MMTECHLWVNFPFKAVKQVFEVILLMCPSDKANVPAEQTVPHACNGKCS